MNKKHVLSWLLAAMMALQMLPTSALAASSDSTASTTDTVRSEEISQTPDGTAEAPYEIASAADIYKIRKDLTAHYVLTADIDLSDLEEEWVPIGSFAPAAGSETGEDPDPAYAFTGVFDGGGHTISNLSVSEDMVAGLFGCVSGGTVKNLTIKNATVSANSMGGAAVGYAYQATVENVTLTADEDAENTIHAVVANGAAPNMVAGIVGAGMDSAITGCTVQNTNLTATGLPSASSWGFNVHDIGLVGGGLEGCTLTNCSAIDSTINVTGPYAFGIGGLSGCAMSSDTVTGCAVSNLEIKVEDDSAYLVGGLVGYTGLTGGDVSEFSDCTVSDVAITVGSNSSRVGAMIGGGFYLEMFKDYYPVPTSFSVDKASSVSGTAITTGAGSTAIGTVAGHAFFSPIDASVTGTSITVDGTTVDNPPTAGVNEDASNMQVIVDGADLSHQIYLNDLLDDDGNPDFSKLDLTNTDIFADGEAGAYLVTLGDETQLVGDTTLARWAGSWESWQNYIYPDEGLAAQYPYLDTAWDLAYDAYIAAFEAAGMGDAIKALYPDVAALKAYWYDIATTKNVDQIEVSQDGADYVITWLDKDSTELASDTYVMTGKILKGFEGAAAYVFTAQTLGDDSEYKYFISMDPGMEGDEQYPIAAHYHFQFGSDLDSMLIKGQLYNSTDYGTGSNSRPISSNLVNSTWYATMTDSTASDLAKYNVILSMHTAEKWSSLPGSGSSSSSGSSGGSSNGYAVSVPSNVTNGTITVSPRNASRGATVTITVTPDEGYALGTLTVTDASGNRISLTNAGNGKYTFTMPSSRVTVNASFAETESAPEQIGSFTDVNAGDWFADAVQYMLDSGMMNGTSATTFSPNTTTTRGMIVTILHRLENEPAASASSFTDVESGAYYADAVAWAAANGIVNGVSATSFAPNAPITREQMAAILYRYASFKGYDVSVGGMALDEYADASQISAYATTAMQWANAEGLITGNTATTINPLGNATRAEVATILMRFCENIA